MARTIERFYKPTNDISTKTENPKHNAGQERFVSPADEALFQRTLRSAVTAANRGFIEAATLRVLAAHLRNRS